jgi:phage gp29-like protein
MDFFNGIRNFRALFNSDVNLADDLKPSDRRAQSRSRPSTKEITPLDYYLKGYFKYLLNPDKIQKYKAGGRGVELYNDIVDKDAHVRSCLKIRKNAVMGLGYEIQPYVAPGAEDATPEDINRANIMVEILSRMKNFRRNMREILSAIEHGYSVNEIRYRVDSDYVVIEELKSRDPNKFAYDVDFNLCYIDSTTHKTVKLDPMYFVQFAYEPRFENPYGSSDMKTVFWAWWFKTNLIKYLSMFSERFAQPTIIGKYPNDWTDTQIDKLLAELGRIQEDTVGVTEEGTQFEMLEPKTRSEAMLIEGIRFFNQEISKGILGNTLSTDEGERSGSLALGKVHQGVRLDLVESDAGDFEACLQDQLIDRLSFYNFGPDVVSPRIRIPFQQPEDLEKIAKTYKELSGIGVEFPKNHIHKRFSIPMPGEDEEVYGGKSAAPANPFGFTEPSNNRKQFRSINTVYFGQLVGVQPPAGSSTFDIANALYYYDDLSRVIRRVYRDIQRLIVGKIDLNSPMYGLVDQVVRETLSSPQTETLMASYIEKTTLTVSQSMAAKFGLGRIEAALQERVFKQLADDYLVRNFYGKGRIDGMASTMRKILQSKVPEWSDVGYNYSKMKQAINSAFVDLKDWKVHQIAQTELSEAAHYAAFEMIDRTGLEFEAYFLVDPASCPICQDWASRNPYTVVEARALGLPHIQCNDQWSFKLKGQ